ncbi:MAG: hypothetical protein CVU24_10530 [Betaproteobacteria bacterium HGW-Betaproteobacteria-18]|nr:MAG: hypothetical protein CVU24_10530 [Betaproteobacteria bacterium HGW-Betaproteobacteria-18]
MFWQAPLQERVQPLSAPQLHCQARCSYHTKTFADERATWNQVQMTFPLPGAQTFGDVTLGAVLAAAKQLGMPEPAARRIVQEVTSRVEKAFAIIVAEHEAGTTNTPPELAVYTAVEARLLRVVQHITLKDMLLRLRDTPS